MTERIKQVTDDLSQVAVDAVAAFGGLSATQLNWKPAAKSWSIAQCFDHLITTHSLYFPEFEQIVNGKTDRSFWEKYSPLSGFFGRFLIKSLDPKNPKKIKTTRKAFPSASDIGVDIIEQFAEHQHQFVDYLNRLPAELDPAKTIVTSPLLGLVTYSLDDTLTFVPMHCRRHFDQAKRVMENEGFPK